MDENDIIFWPPDESIAMSVLDFEEVKESAQKVIDLLNSDLNFKEESRLMNLILGLKRVRTN